MRAVVACLTDLKDQVRQIVQNSGWQCSAADVVGPADLLLRLSQVQASLAVVVLADDRPEGMQTVRQGAAVPGVMVAVVCRNPSAEREQELLAAGAVRVIHEERLREGLRAVLEQKTGTTNVTNGRSIVTLGTNPGCGATTVAVNLAFGLAASHAGKVSLTEIGAGVPEIALDLGFQPPHSVADLVHHWERLDQTMVERSVFAHPQGVAVLAYPEEALADETLEPTGIRQLHVLLRRLYAWNVFDAGHRLTPAVEEAMRAAEAVVLVLRLDVPSLRMTRVLLRALKTQGVDDQKISLVVNRYGQKQQLDWRKAEEHLERPIAAWIPDDPGSLNYALNHGLPLVQAAGRAKITRKFHEFAQQLNGKK